MPRECTGCEPGGTSHFCNEGDWYLFPHDEVLARVLAEMGVETTVSWSERGGYSFAALGAQMREILKDYRIPRLGESGE